MNDMDIIVDDIIQKIFNKNYVANQKLPKERELAESYQVSRYKIRKALEKLNKMNLIYKVQGSGNFVSGELQLNTLLYNSVMEQKYKDIETHILFLETIPASDLLSQYFDIEKGSQVWSFKRIRILNSVKSQIEQTYMPCYLFPNLEEKDIKKSIHNYVVESGLGISHFVTEYRAINISKEDAILLNCKKGQAITKIKNIGYLNDNTVFELSESLNLDYKHAYVHKYNAKKQRVRDGKIDYLID